MNCLVNAVAIVFFVVFGLLLKVMVLLYCWVGFLFESLLMVLQKVCVLCL